MLNCKYCGIECKNKAGKTLHERHCESNPGRVVFNSKTNSYQELYCKYCGKLCFNLNSLQNHERLCKANPNHKIHNSTGKPRLDLRGKPSWNKGLTKATDSRICEQAERLSKRYKDGELVGSQKGRCLTVEERQRISLYMKQSPNTGGIRQGSGRGKHGWYNGFFCDSTYELAYIIYNLDHNIPFKRSQLKYPYTYDGKVHTYHPDFELEDGSLVEVKGYYTEQVQAKIDSVKDRKIVLLMEDDLGYAFDYVKQHYTFDKLEDLYNGVKSGGL